MHNIPADPDPGQQYLAALARGRFQIRRCTDCDRYVFHPRALSPQVTAIPVTAATV